MRTPYNQLTEEQKERRRESVRAYQKRNHEKVKAMRKAYDQSPIGKESKKRCDERYKASGKRADSEKRRAQKPLSEARRKARLKYEIKRRTSERYLDEFASFVLEEAVSLRKLREELCGGKWHIDHIVPVSKGGTSQPNNLQVVPASWNRKKSNKHANKFFGA